MKYIGYFDSVNHNYYKVEIETSNGSGTKELTLGANPFTTEMSIDEKQIYSPIKGTTATIEVFLEDFIFDFYTENPTGTKVKLIKNDTNEVVWLGYITPQIFSQGFSLGPETISLEAVDTISVLENINYKAPEKQVLNFEQILRKILSNVDVRYLFVSDNVQLNGQNGTDSIIDKLFISEMNFFKQKSDTETDDDVCWKCMDVLNEICQFLGYVALMYGEDVYLLDYDAIKKGNPYYYRYDIRNNTQTIRTSVSHSHKIIGEDHYNNEATVSLDNVYNKVTVKADTFEEKEPTNLSSEYGDQNITSLDDSDFSSSKNLVQTDVALWAEVFPSDEDQTKAMDVWIDVHNDKSGANAGGNHNYYDFVAMKFIKKNNCKFYIYDTNWNDTSNQYQNDINYPKFHKNNGAVFVKYFTRNLDKCKGQSYISDKWKEYYKEIKDNPNADSSKYLDYCLSRSNIHSISWTDAIIMNNFNAPLRPEESEWYKYPYFESELEGEIIQGGENSAMIIQGNFYWHNLYGKEVIKSYPCEFKDFKLDKENWINPNIDMFIPASVQWGNMWWNGESWQNTKCGFKLNWLKSEYRDDNETIKKSNTIEQWKCQKTVMQAQPLTNTVGWRFGTTEEGCLIPVPTDQNLSGKPKLTIYRPVSGTVFKSRKDFYNGDDNGKLSGDWNTNNGVRWPWFFVALTSFKFKSLMGDPSYSDANSSDTLYTNVLENDSVEELGKIEFQIHTFDNKVNSYGAVALSGGSSFVDKTFNKALYDNEKTWYESNNQLATDGMRQEEHLIYKLVNQYTTPSKILDCNLKIDTVYPYGIYADTALNDSYIIGSFGTDYRFDYNKIKLIEKK